MISVGLATTESSLLLIFKRFFADLLTCNALGLVFSMHGFLIEKESDSSTLLIK